MQPAGGHSRGQKMADAEITADEDCPECYVQGVCLSLLASTIQSMGYCCWKVREQCRCLAAVAPQKYWLCVSEPCFMYKC